MKKDKLFHRFCGLTILSVIILFFLGGLVRVTESGMGCPDWPKCFGQWVPPTSEADLPENYKEIYKEKRISKVDKLIGVLERMGMNERAMEIRQSQWLFETHPYSFKTAYIEYINRLWGALTGVFAVLALYFSLPYWKTDKKKFVFTLLGLLFIIYNGWLGSLVVDTNLFGGMVTIHFVLAFIAITFFMLAYTRGKESISGNTTNIGKTLTVIALVVAILQLISGTLVREGVDILARDNITITSDNFQILGSRFLLHRLTAPILVMILLGIWYKDRRNKTRQNIQVYYLAVLALVVIQILTGSLNISHSLPKMSQLIHIVAGSLVVTGMIYISIQEFKRRTT